MPLSVTVLAFALSLLAAFAAGSAIYVYMHLSSPGRQLAGDGLD
jgi:hypothetical protein